jgi:hypothetical protein
MKFYQTGKPVEESKEKTKKLAAIWDAKTKCNGKNRIAV